MVQSAMVMENLVDEGQRFIDRLKEDGFVVHEAFWVYDAEAEEWRLYLMTDPSDKGGASLYKAAERSLIAAQPRGFDMNSVAITYPTDPRAAAVRKFNAEHPSRIATNVRGQSVGGIYFDRAYIYPTQGPTTPTP